MNKKERKIMQVEILTSKLIGWVVSALSLFILHTHVLEINSVGDSLLVSLVLMIGSVIKSFYIRKFFHPLYPKGNPYV